MNFVSGTMASDRRTFSFDASESPRTVEIGELSAFGGILAGDLLGARVQRSVADLSKGGDLAGPIVIIIDNDVAVRQVVVDWLESVDIDVMAFGSTREMLEADIPDRPGCFILDVRLPGVSGLDFQQYLSAIGVDRPIIFLTGHGDIEMSVQAMKAGAVDFLTKPVRSQTLLDAVAIGIERDRVRRCAARTAKRHADLVATLTPRQRQVLRSVALGRLNKQIAYDLGISEITVKIHRGNLMRKLCARSVCDLIRLWEVLPQHLRECAPAAN